MKVTYGSGFNPPASREKVERLADAMKSVPQVDCPVKHHFSDGLYIREMTIPAGTVLVGATHKTRHLVTIKGIAKVETETGVLEVNGFAGFIAHPGAKRAFFAVTETVVTNFHETIETDIKQLVLELTESTDDELLGGIKNQQILANKHIKVEV